MVNEDFDYEGAKIDMAPSVKEFYCGKCNLKMEELSRRKSSCPHCGKEGWDVIFQCPVCKEKIKSFQQDLTSQPYCYCDNP
jgi:Zn finger protein HypA/HybF involved in hydrogenase expression